MTSRLVALIVAALQELEPHLATQVPANLGSDTSLFGPDGMLDSLGIVLLVVGLEQAVEDIYGVHVNLADEQALSQQNSPYRTIGSLADYASRLIQAQVHVSSR